jgi:hypothetical protein
MEWQSSYVPSLKDKVVIKTRERQENALQLNSEVDKKNGIQ